MALTIDDIAELLTDYTQYLHRHCYLDADYCMKAPSPILEFLNKNYRQIYKYVVNRENNMKWEKTILDGEICYRLKVVKGIHIDVEPHNDKYIIWISQDEWYYDTLRISDLETAKQIAEGFAEVIKKHRNKILKPQKSLK